MGIRLIKIIYLPLFIAFLLLFAYPVFAEDIPYLVATPKDGFFVDNGVYYLAPGKIGKFEVRYCGLPSDKLREDTLKVELYIDGSKKNEGNVTNIQSSKYDGDSNCKIGDSKYHGDPPTDLSWTPDESSRNKPMHFKVKDKDRESTSEAEIIVDDPPPGATPGGGSWAPPDLKKFSDRLNINDIFGDKLKLSGEIEGDTPQGLIAKILTILLEIAAALALLAFVWSGYQFVTSSGEPGQVEKAKKAMIGAFIGLLIIIFAYSIIRAVDIFSSPPKEDSFKEVKFD